MRRISPSTANNRLGQSPAARAILRRARHALMEQLAPAWTGTRDALRAAIRRFLRPYHRRINFLFRIPREARFAALVAGAVLAGGSGTALASSPINLSSITAGTGGFVTNGEAAGNLSGFRVSSAGDANGDGLADLIVSALKASPHGTYSGRAYVVFGKAGTTAIDLSAITAGTGGFAINGEAAGDRAGFSVSAAGDVNGDGLADLIVGAARADPHGTDSGRAYVVFGKTSTTAVDLSAITGGSGGFVISGEAAGDFAGNTVSGAGDVNGDGLADLIVGAYFADPNGSNSGRAYVIFGKASTTAVELSAITSGTGGFVINGAAGDDDAGRSVSYAGDVNGDGLADLIVGAWLADANGLNSGRSYVIFGKTNTTAINLSDIAAGTGGFVINGESSSDLSGTCVSAGDVNGDGLSDLIVGAWKFDPNGTDSGCTYVIFGKASTTAVELSAISAGTGGFAINGEATFDTSGYCVASAGDVNGDGLADIFVGAYGSDPNGSYSGRGYIVFGKTGTATVELSDITAGTGGFVLNGEASGDHAGYFVSGAGDVNGDGLADMIIGAYAADPNGSSSGRSYVIFSPETAPTSATYKARTIVGDGAGGAVVVPTVLRDGRVTINFSDDDTGSASTETVALTRSKSGISNLGPAGDVANVVWQVTTDRTGFASADVTLHYTDAEISGISGGESGLKIYKAAALSGPWTQLSTTIDTARNEAKATVTGFSFFAIAATTLPVELSKFKIE